MISIYLHRYKKSSKRGFTLVEILVVLGLFSSVMVIAAGALLTTQSVNVKLQETQSILDNVNLSMETMTREIRYGAVFHCNITLSTASSTLRKSCPFEDDGGTVLFFRPNTMINEEDRVAYYLSSNGVLYKDEYIGGATTTYQVTGDDVTIKSLVFYVKGANTVSGVNEDVDDVHDYLQPLITVTLAGETKPVKRLSSTTSAGVVKFTVQTSISSRELDN